MEKDKINVLCATDENYAPYCGIMITSLFESNPDSHFEVFVFVDDNLSRKNVKKFNKLGRKYGNEIRMVAIDNELIKDCPLSDRNKGHDTHLYLSRVAYYRLLAPRLLPDSVHKIIYFDCDVAVIGDIKPFWNVDLTRKAIACVNDCYPLDKQMDERLGYDKEYGYFNSGVVIYNLDYWRQHDTSKQLFDYIREQGTKLKYLDQDVVNGCLYDKKVVVGERYNFQVLFFVPSFWEDYSEEFQQKLLEEGRNAVVIHFCGPCKVWDFRYFGGAFYNVWETNRKKSLWRKEGHYTTPISKYVKFLIKRHLFPSALLRRKEGQWLRLPENEACYGKY